MANINNLSMQQIALSYNKLYHSAYEFTLAKSEQKVLLSIQEFDITHALGLSHFDDVGTLSSKNSLTRVSDFKGMLSGYYTLSILQSSSHFNEEISNTYNSATNSKCTYGERLQKVGDIYSILDNAKENIKICKCINKTIELPR